MTNNKDKQITIYTDGSSRNPGRSGWAAVIINSDGERSEQSGGFRSSTSSRSEMWAAVKALESLDSPASVTLYSDSQYLVKAFTDGWLTTWQTNGWKASNRKPVQNRDLWEKLLALCAVHKVDFIWVKGHAGDKENERADFMANEAANQSDLPADEVYERETAPTGRVKYPVPKPAQTRQADRPVKTRVTSDTIKAFRLTWRLSQEMLARLLDISVNAVARWEVGTATIPGYMSLALEGLAARLASRETHQKESCGV